MEVEGEFDEDAETVADWQSSLERFDRLIWPLFQYRGYTKDAAYLYWTINRLINTVESLPFLYGDDQQKRSDDSDGETWKR